MNHKTDCLIHTSERLGECDCEVNNHALLTSYDELSLRQPGVIRHLEHRIQKQAELIKRLKKCVEYYGNENNWFKEWGHKYNWSINGNGDTARELMNDPMWGDL